jgi:hypothetical protein
MAYRRDLPKAQIQNHLRSHAAKLCSSTRAAPLGLVPWERVVVANRNAPARWGLAPLSLGTSFLTTKISHRSQRITNHDNVSKSVSLSRGRGAGGEGRHGYGLPSRQEAKNSS